MWAGQQVPTKNVFTFKISASKYVIRAGDFKQSLEDARLPHIVNINDQGESEYELPDKTITKESVSMEVSRPSGLFLTSFDERLRDVSSEGPPLIVQGIIRLAKNKIAFEKSEFVERFKTLPQCQDEKAKAFDDFTDQAFYEQVKDVVRIYNSWPQPLSITEGMFRRAAFVSNFETKVKMAETAMEKYNIDRFGMSVYSVVDEKGQRRFQADGDSTLWTGEYMSYLADQYKKRKDPSLLEKLKRSATSFMMLVELLEDRQEFGRTFDEIAEGEVVGAEWQVFQTEKYGRIKVLRGGNNDMYKGLIIGLFSAAQTIPVSDLAFHERLQKVVRLILNLKLIKDSKAISNRQLALGLAALVLKDDKIKSDYENSHSSAMAKLDNFVDGGFYWNGTADISGINLGVVGAYAAFRIAEALNSDIGRGGAVQRAINLKKVYDPLKHTLVILLMRKLKADPNVVNDLPLAAASLATIPFPQPELSAAFDHSQDENFCLSPIPRKFWKAYSKKIEEDKYFYYQGLTTYPIYASSGITSNYIWKDAYFEFYGNSNGTSPSPTDILFADVLRNESH